MLKRQSWPILSLSSYPSARSSPIASRCHRLAPHRRCRRLSTSNDRSNRASVTNALLLDKRQDPVQLQEKLETVTQAASKTDSRCPPGFPENWIDPNSLSESLEAHRWANRNGLAKDGVPIDLPDRRKHYHPGTRRLLVPQLGVKHLNLANYMANTGSRPKLYGGICPSLSSEWAISQSVPFQLRVPWMADVVTSDQTPGLLSSKSQLYEEVKACERYLSPTQVERQAAVDAFDHIKDSMTKHLACDDKVTLIGSRAAGTDGPVSDLDINVRFKSNAESEQNSKDTRERLHTLFWAMRTKQNRKTLLMHSFVRRANVPVIIGTHLPSGLEFQIQSSASGRDTLEVARAFVAEYPTARTLFCILRQMLNMRGLNKGSTGGLTSYPLLNMVVIALKLGGSRVEFKDSGAQLLHFLDFWSNVNFEKQRITFVGRENGGVDPISAIPRMLTNDRMNAKQEYLMALDDPADPTNDLGKSVSRIRHVQALFIKAHEKIRMAMQRWDDSAYEKDTRDHGASVLAWCLEADYSSYEEARRHLCRYSQQKILD